MNKIKKTVCIPLLLANALAVVGLWITGYACNLNPIDWPLLGVSGYFFPVFLVVTVGFLMLWCVVRLRYVLISVAGLLVAYQPVTLYCPVNPMASGGDASAADSASRVTLLSYNTCNFGHGGAMDGIEKPENVTELMEQYIIDRDADIVCIQEGTDPACLQLLNSHYAYHDTVIGRNGVQGIMIYTHFPIRRKQWIDITSVGNSVGAFWLDIRGRETLVVNCHLESMGLSIDEREEFGQMVRGKKDEGRRTLSHTIFGKIRQAAQIRAAQADSVRAFVRRYAGMPIIVCGDFNDVPQSYTHHTIADGITDCYQAVGRWPGYSYRHSNFGIMVRIDNILCSDNFKPISCAIDNSITHSDHFPIVGTLQALPPLHTKVISD